MRPEGERGPDQQNYWNRNLDPHNLGGAFDAHGYDYRSELAYYLTPDQRDVLGQFGALAGKRVLEVGAGLGTNALYMARQGATVIAVDLAGERLRGLRHLAGTAGAGGEETGPEMPAGRVWLVQCSADALPFRAGVFDHAYSKSVLIHTQLEQSVPELYRVLRDGGVGAFVEPMTGNPLVNAYRRTLAPQEWRFITRYFGEGELEIFRRVFDRVEVGRYYLLSFLAFGWQFAVRLPLLFRVSLAVLHRVDRGLMAALPFLRPLAWFGVVRCEKRAGESVRTRGSGRE